MANEDEVKALSRSMTKEQAQTMVDHMGTVGDIRKLLLVLIEKVQWTVAVETKGKPR